MHLKPVQEDDCFLVWQWANEPEARDYSFSSAPIPWDEHVQWFSQKIKSENCEFYVAIEDQNVPIGLVRFDIDANNEATISVLLDKKFRGKGYGSKLIDLASSKILSCLKISQINAYIKPDNLASIGAFLKAGFQNLDKVLQEKENAILAVHLVRK
jgi:UDP-2,4-diacetamido-2,4,6-trideoxy-beta-L-altropyranose hydrolase